MKVIADNTGESEGSLTNTRRWLGLSKQVGQQFSWLNSAIPFLIIACLIGCQNDSDKTANRLDNPPGNRESKQLELSPLENLISSEELILELGGKLGPLNRSAENLRFPHGAAVELFATDATASDLNGTSKQETINGFLQLDRWEGNGEVKVHPGSLWKPFFEHVEYLETAKFYFVSGTIDTKTNVLDSVMGFKSHLRLKDGAAGYANAKLHVVWALASKPNDNARIKNFDVKELSCVRSPKVMFDEVTKLVVPDTALSDELADSEHENMTRRLLQGESISRRQDDNYKLFFPEVTLEHPAVSIVDLDADGLDDFFLSRTHRPSLMFRNLGDGTFEEIGADVGLRFAYDCTCSLFADFDNDGDQDVFVGRARHRTVYLQNDDGRFSDRSELVTDTELPFMVSAISAADYDNNGLLDVYFSTYSPIEGSHAKVLTSGSRWPKYFLNTIEQVDMQQRLGKAHPYLNMAGPPNLLLSNEGDSFSVSDHNTELESWRKSFQSAWCDFDQDGDQDLYVCNDFSPDDLYQNNGDEGFRRVSDEFGLHRLGFGMGVSWQDFNNDGKFDLHVSNMFSKAGTRITKQIDNLDPRIEQMAKGNYLYQFDDEKFELVSLEGPNKSVSKTGWSWGGQMTDLDNDGKMDIVVANGYYSAPKEVEIKIDL